MENLNNRKQSANNRKPLPQLQSTVIPNEKVEQLPTIEPIVLPTEMDEIGQMLNLLFSQSTEKVKVVTKRQILNLSISKDVMGLGSWYSSLRRNESDTLAFLEDQKSKGKKIDPSKVRVLLYPEKNEGFELFKKYKNEKEQSLPKFTANQATGIFLRACLAD